MEAVFLKILNMGITASWIALVVIVARLLLKKAPKWIAVFMWGLVGIRLVCPFSLESAFSLIPSAETVPGDILYTDTPAIHSGVAAFNAAVNPVLSESLAPAAGASVNPMQVITRIASIVWIVGIAAMLIYMAVSYLRIHKNVREAVPFQANIWLCDHVETPFILGVVRPRILLPSSLHEQDLEYVIAHEKAHLKRRDHWWKPLGFLLLTVYWFYPILWIAYLLLCRDIELACDEKVIRDMDTEYRKRYSDALIHCSVPRRMTAACPLAFGEVGVKDRVRSVLHCKKPAFWIMVVAVISCMIVAVCFLTNPSSSVDAKLAVLIDCEIASHHQSEKSKEHFCCLDWEVIGKETDSNLTTVYMWVLYEEFSNENGLTVETGAHIFTAITVEEKNDNYSLIEYWEPQDGSHYADSIHEKIPMHLWKKAMDSQRYINTQSAKLEALAKKHFGITTITPDSVSAPQSAIVTSLRKQYPQYFDLDSSNGLDVYVWQLAENSYSFGLLPHTAAQRDWLSPELMELRGTDANGMRQILSTYLMDESDIYIIPWQNPISSYISDCWILSEGESLDEKLADYIQSIQNMLFGAQPEQSSYDYPICDSMVFDIDDDGKDEYCVLGYGRTSGLFTFTFSASETGADQPEYHNVFCTAWYDLSFIRCEDGVVRVQGVDQQDAPQTHLFDIAILDGNIYLTEDGRDIGGLPGSFPAETQPEP